MPKIIHKSTTEQYQTPNLADTGQIGKQQAAIIPSTKNIRKIPCQRTC